MLIKFEWQHEKIHRVGVLHLKDNTGGILAFYYHHRHQQATCRKPTMNLSYEQGSSVYPDTDYASVP